MTTIIHSAFIFGSTPYYCDYIKSTQILVDQYENYQKRSGRNRYMILTTHGVQTLSIPLVKGKNERQAMKDVKIAYDDRWVENHLHTIRSAYGKSPFFEFYMDDIKSILNKRHQFLLDLNLESMAFILQKLRFTGNIQLSNHYIEPRVDADAALKDLRLQCGQVCCENIPYTQVWAGKFDFVPNLSILDLLFCMGPQSVSILKKM